MLQLLVRKRELCQGHTNNQSINSIAAFSLYRGKITSLASRTRVIYTLVKAKSATRVRTISSGIPPKISTEVQGRFEAISELFKAMSKDLQGINSWRYQRQASPGIQEFIEALSCSYPLRSSERLLGVFF